MIICLKRNVNKNLKITATGIYSIIIYVTNYKLFNLKIIAFTYMKKKKIYIYIYIYI